MGCSRTGSHMAVGYWAPDIYRQIICDQQLEKEKQLLEDQIRAGGMRVALWQSNIEGNKCACYKEANEHADRKCKSCHGTGYIPGYLKFGYTTVWMSVVDSDVILTNCKITTDFKSAKVILNDTATSGTIESGDKSFSRTVVGSNWRYEVSSFIRKGSDSSVTVEYSLNSGLNWYDISDLPTENPSSGTIRFRATLTRTSTGILSPLFEIVRARFERLSYANQLTDGSYRIGPWILVMNEIPNSRFVKSEHGDTVSRTEMRFWTAGLSMFDSEIIVGSRDELIKGEDEGPCDFIEFLDGVQAGNRYIIIERLHSDPFAVIILNQNFVSRAASLKGPYSLVF